MCLLLYINLLYDNDMKITYNNKEYELKYSFRALMIYENITQKSFQPNTLTDIITLFYSIVLAAAKGDYIDYEEFIDWLDDNTGELNKFSEWLTGVFDLNNKTAPKRKSKKKTNTNKDSELPN